MRVPRILSFPAALVALLAGTVFAFTRNGLADPDIWWHLRDAEFLLTRHQFIRTDMFSFTVYGQPWVNPEWLGELPYYLAWRAWGLTGIKLIMILAAEAVFFALFYLCYKSNGNSKASALACYFAVFLAVVNFGPRTILFGYFLLVLLLIILQRFRSQGKGPLWILPLLFCLWVNTHGSWLIGMAVFGIVVVCGLIEGRWGRVDSARWSPQQLRQLLLAMSGSVVALFLNPYGTKLVLWSVLYPFQLKLGVAHVEEWTSVNFHDARGKVALVLIVVLLLGALLSEYRWKLTELALVLFGLYCGLSHIRFLFLAAILTAPTLTRLLDFVPPYRPEIDKPILNALIITGVLVFMLRGFPSRQELEESITQQYPAEVLPYLAAHPPRGPVLNAYLWGGYLGWKDPNFKCFVDSRVDVFEYAGVFKDYIDLLELKNSRRILDKYRIRYVLFPPGEPLAFMLNQNPDWKVVYSGKISTLFERVADLSPEQSAEPAAEGSRTGS